MINFAAGGFIFSKLGAVNFMGDGFLGTGDDFIHASLHLNFHVHVRVRALAQHLEHQGLSFYRCLLIKLFEAELLMRFQRQH